MESRVQQFLDETPPTPDPFDPAVFVVLGYDAARWCDPAMAFVRPDPQWPALMMVRFKAVLGIHTATGELRVSRGDNAYWQSAWQKSRVPDKVDDRVYPDIPVAPSTNGFTPGLDANAFATAIDRLKQGIVTGQFYQANLSMPYNRTVRLADPLDLFAHSAQVNPSPFAGVWRMGHQWMLCNSPERLVACLPDGRVVSRPIAGTRGAAPTTNERQSIAEQLLHNPKELAEHAMLVDLQRNDLGRVCESGTVSVSEWLTLERYSHVTHMVSQVEGQRRPDARLWDIIRATFPGGTITGCPKVRCMQAIEAAEPTPRGWYTGSMGWLNPKSWTMDLNILIRSLWLTPAANSEQAPTGSHGLAYNARVQSGAGIVMDSIAAHEYRECYRKAALWIGVLNAHDRS